VDRVLQQWGRVDILVNNAVVFDAAALGERVQDALLGFRDVQRIGS